MKIRGVRFDTGGRRNAVQDSSRGWNAWIPGVFCAVLVFWVPFLARTLPAQQLPGEPARVSSMNESDNRSQMNSRAVPAPADAENLRRLAQLNFLRRKEMAEDTDRLQALAHALNAEMIDTSTDQLPMDGLQKAAQIEKLAHGVRVKMKASVTQIH